MNSSKLILNLLLCCLVNVLFAQVGIAPIEFDRKIYQPSKFLYIGGYADVSGYLYQYEGVNQRANVSFNKAGAIIQLNPTKNLIFFSETEYNAQDTVIHFNNLFASYQPVSGFGIRAGFINIPIGQFNRYHIIAEKSFIKQPMVSNYVLPVVYSDAGLGIFGTISKGLECQFTYELNIVEGIGEQILYTPSANTEMQLGKNNQLRLNDNNNNWMLNGRFAFLEDDLFEVGASFLSGRYSNEEADTTRNLQVYALDGMLKQGKLTIQSEFALNVLDIPYNMGELYADRQWGTYIDFVYRAYEFSAQKLKHDLTLDVALRYDYVDLNYGYFTKTRENITNETHKLSAGLAFRPIPKSVILLNISYEWFYDLLGNPAKRTSGVELGIASYF